MKTALLSSVAAILLTVASAPAAVITQSQNTGLFKGDFTTSLTGYNRFDPALGTLTSVTVTPTHFLVNTGLWSNLTSSTPQTFYLYMTSELQVATPTHFITYPNTMVTGPISAPAFADGVPFSNGQGNTPGPQVYTDAMTLGIFTGPGNISFNIQTLLTSIVVQGSTSITLFPTLNESATVELTYNYIPAAPVPEPATIALLAMGTGGLLIRRRR